MSVYISIQHIKYTVCQAVRQISNKALLFPDYMLMINFMFQIHLKGQSHISVMDSQTGSLTAHLEVCVH